MTKLNLKIVTPESEIYSGEVDQVNVFTQQGEIGILSHHASLMTQIKPGELKIMTGSKVEYLATGSGILQVANNQVSIMTDLAQTAEDIDERIAEEARKRAQDALEQKLDDEEYATVVANLEKALAQIKVKRRFKSR